MLNRNPPGPLRALVGMVCAVSALTLSAKAGAATAVADAAVPGAHAPEATPRLVVDTMAPESTVIRYALGELLAGVRGLHGAGNGASGDLAVEIRIDPTTVPLDGPAPADRSDGYRIEFSADPRGVRVTGASERGACLGLLRANALMHSAWARTGDWPSPGERVFVPRVPMRGIYTHILYGHAHPWAPRRWTAEEHRDYLRMLAGFGYNVYMTTPGIGVMETPLSDLSREGLQFFIDLRDDLRSEVGMEVWPGDAANEITDREDPVSIFQRGLGSARWVDPGDPTALRAILDNRAELFRVWPDLDAFWVIDGDPGGWPGSTAEEFAALLTGLRDRMDRARPEGAQSALVYWQWTTWSPDLDVNTGIPVLKMLDDRIDGRWYAMVSNARSLANAREAGCLDRSIYFPYHLVEFEPHGPFTNPRLEDIRTEVNAGIAGGALRGSFCNAMSPLIQLPNIAYYQECLWHPPGEQPEPAPFLRDLAAQIVPDHAAALAGAWLALAADPSSPLVGLARNEFDAAFASDAGLGRIGPVGRRWFPSAAFHLDCVARMLEIHEKAGPARDAIRSLGFASARTEDALVDYIRAYLAWNETTGFGHPRRLLSGGGYHWINYEIIERLRAHPELEPAAREMLRRVEARCADLDPALAAAAVRQVSRGMVHFDDPDPGGQSTELRTGDILVIDVGGDLADVIRGMTHAVYTHCGIVVRDNDGDATVIEGVDPVREIPVEAFLGQGRDGRFVHLRTNGLAGDRIATVVAEARALLGRPYDDVFEWTDDRIYCSELVYKAFQRGAGVLLGSRHPLGKLNWRPYEEFIRDRAGGDLPLDRRVITPAELVRCPATRILRNTFPH